jgi:hypothetical protein
MKTEFYSKFKDESNILLTIKKLQPNPTYQPMKNQPRLVLEPIFCFLSKKQKKYIVNSTPNQEETW